MAKSIFSVLVLLLLTVFKSQAQYVTIPDPNMVSWLTATYPSAMSGNQMDTTSSVIVNEVEVNINNGLGVGFPANLDGIQYFDNADTLIAVGCALELIPAFPPNLTYISVYSNLLLSLPELPANLEYLNCGLNLLTILPILPASIIELDCSYNELTVLPTLPISLINLQCYENNLSSLPSLPTSLSNLECSRNPLSILPNLPASLESLYCYEGNLTNLPVLPDSLKYFNCSGNNLTQLPINLPSALIELGCGQNNLEVLPNLPNTLIYLYTSGTNNYTSLPQLPPNLVQLHCAFSILTTLPELPASLNGLFVEYMPNLVCLPILPDSLETLSYDGTNLSCLPNYPPLLNLTFPLLPLCQANNPNGCATTISISGGVFFDVNNDCINSANLTTNLSFQLYDDQNNFLQSSSANIIDNYYHFIQPGVYSVRMDSSFFSSSTVITCPVSGEHNVTAMTDSIYPNRDFGFNCGGVDIGVEAIVPEGIVFPGQPHSVKAIAGDLSNYVILNCAAGTSGTVELSVNGPIAYVGTSGSALVPSVNGNNYTYTISDFSTVDLYSAFVLNFTTDTTAQAGDTITVTAVTSVNTTDVDSTNNEMTYSYIVVNSYDPNMKEVNPINVLPGYQDYFLYTVHFQNLGSAPAFNIKIKDTLDSNLDFESFRVINASDAYTFNLSNGVLQVNFPNIMLPDSASNPEGSKGFVQYQIKPKANLPEGTLINNTAHIFFDYNPAIVTNTTTNLFTTALAIAEIDKHAFSFFPNPSSGKMTFVNDSIGSAEIILHVYDLLGKKLLSESMIFMNGKSEINLALNSGSYLLVTEDEEGLFQSYRMVIEK